MRERKIDRAKLRRMLLSGKTAKACARHFCVSEAAISKARKDLNIAVYRNVAIETAPKIIKKNLDTIAQLQRINDEANRLLDELESDPGLKLKVMSEIRGQLRLQLEIFQTLYDLQAVQEFQQEVLHAIGEVAPDVRESIINKLREKRSVRSAVQLY